MKIKELSWKILTFNIKGRQFKVTDFLIEKVTFPYYNIPCGIGDNKGKKSEIGFSVIKPCCIKFANAGITSAHEHKTEVPLNYLQN